MSFTEKCIADCNFILLYPACHFLQSPSCKGNETFSLIIYDKKAKVLKWKLFLCVSRVNGIRNKSDTDLVEGKIHSFWCAKAFSTIWKNFI